MNWFVKIKPNYCNGIAAAWDEWRSLAQCLTAQGYGHIVTAYEPQSTASLAEVEDAISTAQEIYRAQFDR